MSRAPDLVCLVGLRCAGKTTVGRLLARELGWPFADLDQALAEAWARAQVPPAPTPQAGELLARLGETAFRELEARTLGEVVAAGGPRVLATGGGCVESPDCRRILGSLRTFWLRAEVGELQRRLRADPTLRPALVGSDPAEELVALEARRRDHYRDVAEGAVDAGAEPERVVAELLGRLEIGGR